jgi:hypothetical protein
MRRKKRKIRRKHQQEESGEPGRKEWIASLLWVDYNK